jgi:trypsin
VRLAFCVSVAAFLLVSCGERPTEESSHVGAAVFGGAADPTDGVVAVLLGPVDAPTALCSGVAVSSRIVVTAAHCIAGASGARVQVGARLDVPAQTVDVAQMIPYPSYRSEGNDQLAGYDLALVRTVSDLQVTPIAVASTPDDLAVGSAIDVVGFGRTNPLDPASTGVRTRARLTVSVLCDRLFGAGDETHGFCNGDSGGAVLSPTTGALVGVIGFGVKAACEPPGYSTRIAPYARWIASFVDGADDSTCSTCPAPAICPALEPDAGPVADADGEVGPLNDVPAEAHGGCSTSARERGGVAGAMLVLGALSTWSRRRRFGDRRPRRFAYGVPPFTVPPR